MIEVEIVERTPGIIHPAATRKLVLLVGKREPLVRGHVAITIIGEKRMRSLNKQFRGIDKATDVLSFAWREDSLFKGNFQETLGELYVCPQIIRKQAKRFKTTPREEYIRMMIHGLLHLVGYDHMEGGEARKMFSLQESLVKIASTSI